MLHGAIVGLQCVTGKTVDVCEGSIGQWKFSVVAGWEKKERGYNRGRGASR